MADIDTAETHSIWSKHGNYIILTASCEKASEGEAEGKTNNLYLWREHNSSKKETANIDIDAEENETNSGSSRKKNTSCGQA